ncbi:uroporphyrinogen-III C-methyltransferase [Thioclava sp. GXIMD4216]|uniref:uroporphyrinogen-III C-methyltransferase n=1 Tax=unclassified Thioclava TaxID=2621713 RepID=UPI0030CDA69E
MSGFVSFVSSGPGDPELLTLRAADRIRQADAILFDDLSAGPILDLARPDCDLIGVGKRAGRPSPKQDHVSRLLVDHARSGGKVVRLKSGDCGIFGRLEEELAACRAAGIAFEIVPGVTAASSAAAAAQIPLTRRLTARRLQFVTGHDVTGALPDEMNMAALADPQAVTAVYMARRTFVALSERLAEAGLDLDTPALMAESISHPDEVIWRGTMRALAAKITAELSAGAVSQKPALIFYGALAPA